MGVSEGDGGGYLLLTFMLPNAEGCGTGLQLSAKDVVRGRPDMMIPTIPTAVNLAWGGGGGGWVRDSVASYTAGLLDSSPPNLLIQKATTSEWVARYLQGARQPGKAVTLYPSSRIPRLECRFTRINLPR